MNRIMSILFLAVTVLGVCGDASRYWSRCECTRDNLSSGSNVARPERPGCTPALRVQLRTRLVRHVTGGLAHREPLLRKCQR